MFDAIQYSIYSGVQRCGIGQIDGKLGADIRNDTWAARVNDSIGATRFPKNISYNALQEKPLLLTFCTHSLYTVWLLGIIQLIPLFEFSLNRIDWKLNATIETKSLFASFQLKKRYYVCLRRTNGKLCDSMRQRVKKKHLLHWFTVCSIIRTQ